MNENILLAACATAAQVVNIAVATEQIFKIDVMEQVPISRIETRK